MADPAGPTGVITLKKIGDITYEQYGAIVLSTTGITQVTASTTVLDSLFSPNIESTMTWVEDFSSRLQGAVNANQSSFYNTATAGWEGGAWGTGAIVTTGLVPQATISGVVRSGAGAGNSGSALNTNESAGTLQSTTRIDRNPTMYMRFVPVGAVGGRQGKVGWGDINNNITVNGICFRWDTTKGSVVEAAVSKASTASTISTSVLASADDYHTYRAQVHGGGTSVEFFVDGISIGSVTTNIPAATVNLGPRTEQAVSGLATVDLDYMAVSQQRMP
jgi:hypothetical protein